MAQKQATLHDINQWSALLQQQFLLSLIECGDLSVNEIAFHGGTSLHMSWGSPRFSEDLDFLLSRSVDKKRVHGIMMDAFRQTEKRMAEIDSRFEIEIGDRTKDEDRMLVFTLKAGMPKTKTFGGILGKSMVKVEMWLVADDYLPKYPSTFKKPIDRNGLVSKLSGIGIPAAKLETAFADKLTAFATRPFLKWRDLFDVWWIGTQSDAVLDKASVLAQFKHNLGGYTLKEGACSPAEALRLAKDRYTVGELVEKAEVDLKPFLDAKTYEHIKAMNGPGQNGIEALVRYVLDVLDDAANQLEPTAKDTSQNPLRAKKRFNA